MTLPNESLAALKRTRKFLSSQLGMRKQTFRNMSVEEFEGWRKEACRCLYHFPFDCQLDQLYAPLLCEECGESKPFHKNCCTLRGKE